MKRLIPVLAVIALLAGAYLVEAPRTVKAISSGPAHVSRIGDEYFAAQYAKWGANIVAGNTATGSQTVTVCPAMPTLPDGRTVAVFAVGVPIQFDNGGPSAETVTLTAVSASSVTQSGETCENLTGSFNNTHGASQNPQQVISGDGGILEAFADAAQNGGGDVYWSCDAGNITISTSSTTNTTSCSIPKTWLWTGQSVYVTTTITTTASYGLGIASHTTSIASACTALTAGTNCSQFVPSPTALAGGSGLGALLLTTNAAAGAGVAHVKVWGETAVASSY
jgi:hypothetical protein